MKHWPWYCFSIVIIAIDQLTKYWASQSLIPYQPYEVFSLLNMTLAHNTGVAFSFLSGYRGILAGFSLVMSIVLVIWMSRIKDNNRLQLLALSLVLGGAIGNFYDRAFMGYVIDFIDFHYKNYHFAIFNLADAAISMGVILLFGEALLKPNPKNSELGLF